MRVILTIIIISLCAAVLGAASCLLSFKVFILSAIWGILVGLIFYLIFKKGVKKVVTDDYIDIRDTRWGPPVLMGISITLIEEFFFRVDTFSLKTILLIFSMIVCCVIVYVTLIYFYCPPTHDLRTKE